MAKKPVISDSPEKKKIVKVFLTAEQARLLRIAAALRDQSMGDYARDVVLAAATQATAGMGISSAPAPKPPKRG